MAPFYAPVLEPPLRLYFGSSRFDGIDVCRDMEDVASAGELLFDRFFP